MVHNLITERCAPNAMRTECLHLNLKEHHPAYISIRELARFTSGKGQGKTGEAMMTGNHMQEASFITRFLTIIAPCLFLLALAACGKDSPTKTESPATPPAPPPPPPVQSVPTSIVITPSPVTLTSIGQTQRLTAAVSDQNGQAMPDASVAWSSGNGAVATVSAEGLVTAVGNGSTQITARSGNATASITVTVAYTTPDREALLSLYHATGGPNWTNNTHWLSDMPLGEWHGVTTNDVGSVKTLDLAENNLEGSIPSELNQLKNLETLRFQGNALSGSIPPELGRLADLQDLWLNGNQLSGSIPPELGQLTMLVSLQLNDNPALNGPLPGEMTKLVNLNRLWIHNTRLSVPQTDRFASWLEGISDKQGTSNGPGSEDPERDALIALYNRTDGPNWTTNTNWLSDRPLGEWHGVTTNEDGTVKRLILGDNNLSGSIPSELGQLANLQDLFLDRNQLSGSIPSELGQLANLQELSLDRNQLSGSIPSELGQLANLQELSLSSNELSGSIPSELGQLANLRTIFLSVNQLSGPIPPELGQLANLRSFWLRVNALSGPIPPELGQLSNLVLLHLGTNELSGPIPPELGRLANLLGLYLGFNELSGPIPPELGRLANLSDLYLGFNELSGPIPPELGQLSNLEMLNLRFNALSGPIPSELGQLANLRRLSLDGNQLSGPIPPELGQLSNLQYLSLNRNQLSGPIPPELGQLSNLETLYLSFNQLSGCIPEELREVQNSDLDLLNLPFCDTSGSSAIIGSWNLTGHNLHRIVEKINMNFIAAGEEPDFFLEFLAGFIDLAFPTGLRFVFEENGVFVTSFQGVVSRGTWSEVGNMLTLYVENEESIGTYVVEENKLTLTLPSEFEYELPSESELTIAEVLKDVPEFELYFTKIE